MENPQLLIVNFNSNNRQSTLVDSKFEGKVEFLSADITMRLNVEVADLEAVKQHIRKNPLFATSFTTSFANNNAQSREITT